MDWADDVAYSVHDVEDGIHGGYVPVRRLIDDADERAAVCQAAADTYSPDPADALAPVLDDLLADPALVAVADHDGAIRGGALRLFFKLRIARSCTRRERPVRQRAACSRTATGAPSAT